MRCCGDATIQPPNVDVAIRWRIPVYSRWPFVTFQSPDHEYAADHCELCLRHDGDQGGVNVQV
jgi:hypothetical protein